MKRVTVVLMLMLGYTNFAMAQKREHHHAHHHHHSYHHHSYHHHSHETHHSHHG